MKSTWYAVLLGGAAGVVGLGLTALALGQNPAQQAFGVPDPPNGLPVAVKQAVRFDRGKGGIENPLKDVLAFQAAIAAAAKETAKAEAFVNPKVEPGLVKWHADLDTACKVSAKSGKPVLLFQMMGKLDEKFC